MLKKKTLGVSSAALVDLKAALFRKQQEFKKEKKSTHDLTSTTRKVSEKTASIWKSASSSDKKSRKKDGKVGKEAERRQLSYEEEEELAKSKRALEAKAALYDRLSRGVGLREEVESEGGEDGEGGDTRYMVDFTKKIWQEQSQSNSGIQPHENNHTEVENSGEDSESEQQQDAQDPTPDEEWVEYVDSLGRSRQCLKKDLEHFKSVDENLASSRSNQRENTKRSPTPDLLSEDMRRERERRKWEREAEQEAELDEPVGPVHYQAVQGGEIRSHGIGYYAFSMDESKRKEQMDLLDKLRVQTLTQREKRQKLQEKRKAILEARLAKVRQRKLKQLGKEVGEEEAQSIADLNFEQKEPDKDQVEDSKNDFSSEISALLSEAKEESRLEEERRREAKRAAHVRPWDKGKVTDPIRKRKQELRDERPSEFAPPSFYSDTSNSAGDYSSHKKTKTNESAVSDDASKDAATSATTNTHPLTYNFPPPPLPGSHIPFPAPPMFPHFPGQYPPPPPGVFFPPPPHVLPPGGSISTQGQQLPGGQIPGPPPPPYLQGSPLVPPPPPPGIPPVTMPGRT